MAASTVITQQHLDLAGISGGLGTAILGLTIAAAAKLLLEVFQLRTINASYSANGVVSYTLNGQSVTSSMADIERTERFIKRMMSSGGGPIALGILLA